MVRSKVPTRVTPHDLLDNFPDKHPSMINAFVDDLVDLVTDIDISTVEDCIFQDMHWGNKVVSS